MSQHRWTTPGSFGKRLIAFMIDLVVLKLIGALIGAVCSGSALSLAFVSYGFGLAYMVFLPYQFGWTLGKKAMGLQIVNQDSEDPASIGQMLMRETVGRFVCVLTLGYGYIHVLFNESREGFHDRISRTQVIDTQGGESSSSAKFVFAGLASVLLLVGGVVYVLLFTSVPLQKIAASLENSGIKVDGIHGSLWSGVSIDKVSSKNANAEFEAENVVFDYGSISEMFKTKDHIHIKEVSVSKVTLNILNLNGWKNERASSSSQKPEEIKPTSPTAPVAAAPAAGAARPTGLLLDRVDISEVQVQVAGEKKLSIRRFLVSNFDFNEKRELRTGQVWFDSDYLLADIKEIQMLEQNLKAPQIKLIFRKGIKPELLAGDVDVNLNIEGSYKDQQWKVQGNACRNSLQVQWEKGELQLTTQNFQPHWYVKNFPPLHTVNISGKGNLMTFIGGLGLQGSYVIRNQVFKLVPSTKPGVFLSAVAELGKENLTSGLLFKGLQTNPPVQIALESSLPEKTNSILSQVYFSKAVETLNPNEQAFLQAEQRFYSLPVFVKPPPPIFDYPQLSKMKMQQQRLPAQVPTKLPPKRVQSLH